MNLDSYYQKINILNQIEKLHDVDLPENLVQQELDNISGIKKRRYRKK